MTARTRGADLGHARHSEVNTTLTALMDTQVPCIAAHRGTASGTVVENTIPAVQAAIASGAGMVEIDVVRSADGEFFAFHDGYEDELLAIRTCLTALRSVEIEALRFRRVGLDRAVSAHGPALRPPRLSELLRWLRDHAPGVVVNLDRSWGEWPRLLPRLDEEEMPDRILLKCGAGDIDALTTLAGHPVAYPLLLMCRGESDLELLAQARADRRLNLVGAELISTDPGGVLLDRATIAAVHAHGLFVFVNAEAVPEGTLSGGMDDEVSVIGLDPDAGWGALTARGVDVIQTDWPWLLRSYWSCREDPEQDSDREERRVPPVSRTPKEGSGGP